MPEVMLPRRVVVLVNADFESRADQRSNVALGAYEADAAVLETARSVSRALASLGVVASELRLRGELASVANELTRRAPEVVFNLVESIDNDYGREWEVPDFLAAHGFRYTGNGSRPLLLCRSKDQVRDELARCGVRVARGAVLNALADLQEPACRALHYPVFVKPARVDGSIGIDRESVCHDLRALERRCKALFERISGPLLVEEFLPGKEINVSLFPAPRAGHVVATEIDFSEVPPEYPRIVTYDAKWNEDSPEYRSKSVKAALSPALFAEVSELSRTAFLALGGSGYGRVDLRLDAEGRPTVIDVNPNCDIDAHAGMALAAESAGIAYPELIRSILEEAMTQRTP